LRQKDQTPLDAHMRTALENMQYAACTLDDIAFLRSHVASNRPDRLHLDTEDYRNVSMITALNIHKDTINKLGMEHFAADTGQDLVDFYSVDKLRCKQACFRALGPKLQDALRKAMPSTTSDHIPGQLCLCVNMPVMIKANDTTELCITKGQEAIIVGWDSSVGPQGQLILDTLFVKLVKPPRDVQIADLPINVVSAQRLIRFSKHD
ncbi:hypothetical protein B0H17DRAFT_963196, partial [Mycena rosella]